MIRATRLPILSAAFLALVTSMLIVGAAPAVASGGDARVDIELRHELVLRPAVATTQGQARDGHPVAGRL